MTTAGVDSMYLRHSPDGVVIVDENGIIEFVNPKAEALFGYSAEDLAGQPVESLVPDRFATVHRAHRTRYRAEPRSRAMGDLGNELYGLRRDGSEFPLEISLSPVDTVTGPRVMACVRDITERHVFETELRRVRNALNAVREAVFMFEPANLQFGYVNDGAVEQVGYSREELVGGMTPLHIKPEFTSESFRALVDRLTSGERESLTFTTIHRRKDGTDVIVEVALQYLEPSGTIDGVMVAFTRDVTQRHAAEGRARAERESRRLAEDRERIARDLHDVVIQRLFAAGMRLQAGLSNPEILATRSDETVVELDETIAIIRRTIFALTENDVASPSTRIQALSDAHTDRTGANVDVNLSGEVDSIDDAVMAGLEASLTEALSNVARHAGAQNVTVDVAVGDDVVLRVSDDGVGIPDIRSAGFGLPNVGVRAEELGGEFNISAGAEGGTDFEWKVPGRQPAGGGT